MKRPTPAAVTLAVLIGFASPVFADSGSAVTIPAFVDAGIASDPAVAPDAQQGSAVTPPVASPAPAPATLTPQAEDIGVLTKLWKNGAFFALGVVAVYLGLTVWSKLDKKHAWYAATAAGALVITIEGIRKGDTPTAMSLVAVVGPLAGVLIKGPGSA